jgi:hypothetical protein
MNQKVAPGSSEIPTSSDHAKTTSPDGDENPVPSSSDVETQTLGVLFVHGIGAQRRGDALVQCATALHRWLRGWLRPELFETPFAIDLVDASIAESGPDHPAQVRIIFRQGNQVSRFSWLLAESCWFETYRRPSFFEFVVWALRVLPLAVVVHFLPRYRRAWNAFKASTEALESKVLTPRQFAAITEGLGLAPDTKLQDVAQQKVLETYRDTMMWRCLTIQLKLALVPAAALVIQLLLVAVAILAILPGPTRSLARWVQLKLSATLGDSYLFVESPLTGAAIASRVKKDLEWLASRCDRIIVVAHSQGAAVAYSAVQREFWGGSVPKKLHALVTYGSGLRKLFDLEQTDRDLAFWGLLGVYATVVSVLMTCLTVLFLAGAIPWWGLLPGIAAVIVLQMFPLLRPQERLVNPAVLRVPWYDCYASHDPVPSGPIDFKRAELSENASIEQAVETYMDSAFVQAFKGRQREVVNRRSILADHTRYWSSDDDFVAHIAEILANASEMPITFSLDDEWLQIATRRRRWRVGWLSRCRGVAGLVGISVLLWPRAVLDPIGRYARAEAAPASMMLPQKVVAWASHPLIQDWALGAGVLILGIWLIYLVTAATWHFWDREEVLCFFRRSPYRSMAFVRWAFGAGWIGLLAGAPLLALAHAAFSWKTLLATTWAPITLALSSAWFATKSGQGPTSVDLGRRALSLAQANLANKELDRLDALRAALFFFRKSTEHLQESAPEEWALAVLGETRVIEELARSDARVREMAKGAYEKAIKALEDSGRDASEVKARLLAIS